MERLKRMSLKKAFFCLTALFLLIALILSLFSVLGIGSLLGRYGASLEMRIEGGVVVLPEAAPSRVLPPWYRVLGILQLVLPVLFVAGGLLAADLVFYRVKLRRPLAELQAGAERIMRNDLDFSIRSFPGDELGELCGAFEEMRLGLLKNNRELWRQMEERKRLNAAFSHDLRNPVTVLKGSAKILKKGLSDGTLPPRDALDPVSLIEEYAERIGTYIEAMSSIQRLEELPCSPKELDLEAFAGELSDSIRLLAMDSGVAVEERFETPRRKVRIDRTLVLNVAENLIANAERYAKAKIRVGLTLDAETLLLSVRDDGPGFPQTVLQRGAEPFLRGGEEDGRNSHFGMGLYVCRLLCEKHGGSLTLRNTPDGASATAGFHVSEA